MGYDVASSSSNPQLRKGRWDALEKELLPFASRITNRPDETHDTFLSFGGSGKVHVVWRRERIHPTWAQQLYKRIVCRLNRNRYEGCVRQVPCIRVTMPKETSRSWQQRLVRRLWDSFKLSKRQAIGRRLFESREAAVERRLREHVAQAMAGQRRRYVGVPGVL
ncbi:hypothetical protein [Cupriavidus sp. AU9028]|uniref:hypothetical protein n=1 Tax=Cupriavidus sp. AU9028 TaxID=2871157 RepID=UPI001C951192|nr:hypothetical protein [Cupriavidus sp. AU9028]MBY4898002.1 hypothetical protein [Cupriavidus sp. AU9028]